MALGSVFRKSTGSMLRLHSQLGQMQLQQQRRSQFHLLSKSTKQSTRSTKLTTATTATAALAFITSTFILLTTSPSSPLSLTKEVKANSAADDGLHPPAYPWAHKGVFDGFDHAAIRRGYQVYREVCAACHSLDRIAFRTLVGVSHTADEARAMAEEIEYTDGPNDQGEMFDRPGKLADYMPKPYPNEEAARVGNGGALPPDLSLMIKARHGGADYVFALLTGYCDAPAGVTVGEGQHYNPYFPGGALAMARVLYDGLVEYPDGTPATTTQMAKDVTTFLAWTAEPELDDRKRLGIHAVMITSLGWLLSIYIKRYKWAPIKTRKIVYNPPQ